MFLGLFLSMIERKNPQINKTTYDGTFNLRMHIIGASSPGQAMIGASYKLSPLGISKLDFVVN